MKSANNMSFFFCEDEKWKYAAYDKPGNLRRLWEYGEIKSQAEDLPRKENQAEAFATD